MICSCLRHGQCFARNGQRARPSCAGIYIKSENDICAACAVGVTVGDVQPRGVCGRRPRGVFWRRAKRDGVSSRGRAFDARGESDFESIRSDLLNEENQLGRANQSDEEYRFDATALQKAGAMDETKTSRRREFLHRRRELNQQPTNQISGRCGSLLRRVQRGRGQPLQLLRSDAIHQGRL